MAKVIFGNHSSVLVPRQDRDSTRKFYCDVLGGGSMGAPVSAAMECRPPLGTSSSVGSEYNDPRAKFGT